MNDPQSKIVNQERSSLCSNQYGRDANTHKKVQAVVSDRPTMFIYHDVNDPEPTIKAALAMVLMSLPCHTLSLILSKAMR